VASDWIPFGGGIGRCLGASFAELEMVVRGRVLRRSACSGELACGTVAPQRDLLPRKGTLVPKPPSIGAPAP
jgi:cytochrome P450